MRNLSIKKLISKINLNLSRRIVEVLKLLKNEKLKKINFYKKKSQNLH